MEKRKNVSLSKNFEKDIGLFLGLGTCFGITSGVIVASITQSTGLWLSVGISLGFLSGFSVAIIKNFEELSNKIKYDKLKKRRN